MPTLGLNPVAEKASAKGLLSKGATRPAVGPVQKVRSWTIFSHQHLALGLLPSKSVTLNSAEIRLLQTQLASLGYYDEPVDGQYGPKTKAAHARYRKSLLQRFDLGPVSTFADHMTTAAEAEAKAGVKETGGSNRGPRVDEYQKCVGTQFVGQPWCACFVCWCMQQAAKSAGNIAFKLPKEAAAFRFEDWAVSERSRGVYLLDPDGLAMKRGDIVIFDFSHIGICTAPSAAGAVFKTVEGNTTATPAASKAAERDGGGVHLRERPTSVVRSVVRLGYPVIDTAYPTGATWA